MTFIRIFPLQETENLPDERFGSGEPARCRADYGFGAKEYYLNIAEIAAFEECPLYLLSEVETDALVDGIRIRLRSGETIIVPDDPPADGEGFHQLLARAARGEIVAMAFSRYLRELERTRRNAPPPHSG